MTNALFNELAHNIAIARTDALLNQRLVIEYGTHALASADTALRRSTWIAMAWNIQQARSVFKGKTSLLKGVVSAATKANALAVWGDADRHWIVVTDALATTLRDAAEINAAHILAAFPAAFHSATGRQLRAATPLEGCRTFLGSMLYFGAISFFVSHEVGHHLAGHDTYYQLLNGNAASDEETMLLGRSDIPQALERQADAVGVGGAAMVIAKVLNRHLRSDTLTRRRRKEQQELIAILLAAAIFTATARFSPKPIAFDPPHAGRHPPDVYRVITIASLVMDSLRSLSLLDDTSRSRIRVTCLETILGARIDAKSIDRIAFEQRAARGEAAALRLAGIRRALFDPGLKAYQRQLDAGFLAIKSRLNKRV